MTKTDLTIPASAPACLSIDELSFDEIDEIANPRPEETDFDRIVEQAISRRGFLSGVLVMGSAAALSATTALTPGAAAAADRFGFDAVAANTRDGITLPTGFKWDMVISWGDPIFPGAPEFDGATRGTGASQATSFGDNIDGMALFSDGQRDLLVCNNEYTNRKIIWGNRAEGAWETDDDVEKGMMAHGVSVVEVAKTDGRWLPVQDSRMNRRITPQTPMDITGPARGHDMLKTSADPAAEAALGTWNNCGNGRTPWGTYLACEENFNGYFSSSVENAQDTPEFKRYGVRDNDWGYGWRQIDARFDISKEPNEPNRAGYVVEIDPFDPNSKPRKLTALGRFKHENAEMVINSDGKVVVYMGDDERGEFLYRFVSDGVYTAGGDNAGLLEDGTLYAAKFDNDGTGTWMELSEAATGMTKAEICIYTRMAGSKVGATTMDRPEWVASNPVKAELYCALTNNKNRGIKTNAGGDATPAEGPNPRVANNFGQVVRWWPANADHTADQFRWDLYVMAGNPTTTADDLKGKEEGDPSFPQDDGSANINAGNMFNSPDGLAFSENGLLFIQTDGNYSNKGQFVGMGNNQMLVGDPATGEIRRFLVGPNECEVTGSAWSSDNRTLFVGIQHPGERGNSHWPGGGDSVPRSAVIAITREDGGVIG
ncbi:MAG: PhoX family phosphatase [Ahrensia sp.]|nr:PhoX family phosphatase [Ahrensia sp.]